MSVIEHNLGNVKGPQGDPGRSAYELWLDAGNIGTEADFLESLKGKDGDGTSSSSFALVPNTWELEDLTIRTGHFTNVGSGWNTYTFPEPFDGVPIVFANCDGYTTEVGTITETTVDLRILGMRTIYAYADATTTTRTAYSLRASVVTDVAIDINYIAIDDGRAEDVVDK